MKNRMNVPEAYEPKLPQKVEAYITEKKAAASTEKRTTYYQCVDLPNFWAKDGHKSYKQEGVSDITAVLNDPKNEGALMITYQDNRHFKIQNRAMHPIETGN